MNLSKDRIKSLNLILFGNGVHLNVWGQVNDTKKKMYLRRNHLAVLSWVNWSLKRRETEEQRPVRVLA